jgi:hypothetical protein
LNALQGGYVGHPIVVGDHLGERVLILRNGGHELPKKREELLGPVQLLQVRRHRLAVADVIRPDGGLEALEVSASERRVGAPDDRHVPLFDLILGRPARASGEQDQTHDSTTQQGNRTLHGSTSFMVSREL